MRARLLAVAGLAVVAAVVWLVTRPSGGGAASPGADAGARRVARPVAVPSAAVGRVAGTVRSGDVPVRGATVRLELGGAPRSATSDGFGQFAIEGVAIAAGTIEASADGYTGDSRAIDLRTAGGARGAERLELLLTPCTDEIHGQVRDVAGAPLPDAEVLATVRSGRAAGRAATGGDGRYRMCVAGRQLGVRAAAPGYGAASRVIVAAGSTRVDFRLGPEAVIEGRVVEDANERPVAGAEVEVGWPGPAATVRSDESGGFRLAGLPPGRHRLHATAGDDLATAGPTEVDARVGVAAAPVVLRLGRASQLQGRVVDGAGRPIPGQRVATADPSPARLPLEATCDEEGRFLLGPLVAGRTLLVLAGEEGSAPREVLLPHEGEVVLQRKESGWVRGRVVHERRPVAGAQLAVDGRVAVGRTRADGTFLVGPLAAGPIVLTAEHDLEDGQAAVTVGDGLERGDLVIELSRGATAAGVVVDQRGEPVAGARVHLWAEDGSGRQAAAAALDGSFLVTGLDGEGDYRVSVFTSSQMVGLPPAEGAFAPVHLDEDHRHVEGLRLMVRVDRATLAGVVRRAGGEPAADATVALVTAMGRVDDATITGEDGRFELADLVGDRFDVMASTSAAVRVRVNDVAAGRRDLVLTLPATGGLRGEITGFSRVPQVMVGRADRTFLPLYFPAVDGTGFVLEDLPAGPYRVRAVAGGALAEAVATVTAGAEARVTLRSAGAAHLVITARVEETGAPLAGALCGYALASDPDAGIAYDRTDGSGRLGLEAPADQDLLVACKPKAIDVESSRPVPARLAAGATQSVQVTLARRPYLGLQITFDGPTPLVERASGPASAAGILPGDVIAAIEGFPTIGVDRDTFYGRLLSRPPGTTLRLSLVRSGTAVESTIFVGRMPDTVPFGEL